MEVVNDRPTWLAGKEAAAVPFRIEPFIARNLLLRCVRFAGHHVLTVRTPIGRKVRPHFIASAAPLIRVKPKDFTAAGITRVGRIVDVRDGLPVTDDDQVIDVANVVWCTGYRPGFSWIDLPVLGDRQEPQHERGVLAQEPGLYFVGLEFIYSATSATITGVGRDAKRVVKNLTSRASPDLNAKSAAARQPRGRARSAQFADVHERRLTGQDGSAPFTDSRFGRTSKLVMRVRFPSPALLLRARLPWSHGQRSRMIVRVVFHRLALSCGLSRPACAALSMPGPPRPDHGAGAAAEAFGLQAVGTGSVDGALADGHRRRREDRGWVRGEDRLWGR